jgi:hypothetical protein
MDGEEKPDEIIKRGFVTIDKRSLTIARHQLITLGGYRGKEVVG